MKCFTFVALSRASRSSKATGPDLRTALTGRELWQKERNYHAEKALELGRPVEAVPNCPERRFGGVDADAKRLLPCSFARRNGRAKRMLIPRAGSERTLPP